MTSESSEAGPTKARLLIVDDHPVVREGLAMHIAMQPDLEVCGEAEDLPAAMALLKSAQPDVAIIDVSLKDSNGIELIRRIRARDQAVRILVWSMYPEHLYAERALRAGAMGYVHKGRETREIVQALNAVAANVSFVEIESDKGHDAFLLDEPELFATIRGFLNAAAAKNGLRPAAGRR